MLLLSGLMILTAASSLPPPSVSDEAPVEVVGQRPLDRREALEFVRSLKVSDGLQQAARWVEPVCPKVVGLAEQHARIVEAQLRTIAREAKVPLAKDRCTANATVIFVGDGAAAVRQIDRRNPFQLGEVPRRQRGELLNGPAPVRWWYTTQVLGKDGNPVIDVSPPWLNATDASGNRVDLPSRTLPQTGSGLIGTGYLRALQTATVIVDVNGASGASLASVADYAGLILFAEIGQGATAEGSILSLFGSDRPARRFTLQDRRFLTALYRIPLDRHARRQMRALAGEIAQP